MGSKFACSTCSVIRGCKHALALPDHGCNAKFLSVEGKRGPVQEKARSFPLREKGLLFFIPVALSAVCMRVCLCVNAQWCSALAHRQHQSLGPGWWLPSCRPPVGTPLCCQPCAGSSALTALCVPTYQPRLPVLWDTRSCCRGTRVSTGNFCPSQWPSPPQPTPYLLHPWWTPFQVCLFLGVFLT